MKILVLTGGTIEIDYVAATRLVRTYRKSIGPMAGAIGYNMPPLRRLFLKYEAWFRDGMASDSAFGGGFK